MNPFGKRPTFVQRPLPAPAVDDSVNEDLDFDDGVEIVEVVDAVPPVRAHPRQFATLVGGVASVATRPALFDRTNGKRPRDNADAPAQTLPPLFRPQGAATQRGAPAQQQLASRNVNSTAPKKSKTSAASAIGSRQGTLSFAVAPKVFFVASE